MLHFYSANNLYSFLYVGYPLEKKLYNGLRLTDFVQRLLDKRCVAFLGASDSYLLLSGERGNGYNYPNVGKPTETAPLLLKNCLSYDEIKVFLGNLIMKH